MKILTKALVSGLLFCWSAMSSVQAKDVVKEPTVSVLKGLLGRKIDDGVVQDFVKEQRLSKYAKGDSGGYSRFSDETGTFSLLFRGNIISRVVINLMPIKGVSSPFRGVLPSKVLRSDRPKDVLNRLGKPQYNTVGKDGEGCLVYELSGSGVTFAFLKNKIYEIDLDVSEPKIRLK